MITVLNFYIIANRQSKYQYHPTLVCARFVIGYRYQNLNMSIILLHQ